MNAMLSDKVLQSTSLAAKAVEYCNRIYHEERYEQRLAKIKPLLDEFFAWLESLQVGSKSKLAEAVRYALNEKPNLCTFLQDGNVPID